MADPADDLLPLMGLNFGVNNMNAEDNSESDSNSDATIASNEEVHGNEEQENEDEEEGGNQEELAQPIERKKKRKKSPSRKKEKAKQPLTVNFDQSLPSTHSYLGSDLEDIRGRTIHEDNMTLNLPVVALPNVVLVPGQVIPLQLFQQRLVAMIRRVADTDKTFGVINDRSGHDGNKSIGCTAEIFSMKNEMDEASGISMIRVKARGRQRFQVLDIHTDITGEMFAKVKILPEVSLSHPLEGAFFPSLRKLMLKGRGDEDLVKTAVDRRGQVLTSVDLRTLHRVDRMTAAYLTQWPPWVYKMYDIEWLSEQIQRELGSWSATCLPSDPVDLSFWVAHNLPVDDKTRLSLLSLDSVVQRLRFGLSIIRLSSFLLSCDSCEGTIANRNDMFSMSREGPLGAYVNPGGYIHEMFTVTKVKNLTNIGGSSTEHSWFPGYAWTIVNCQHCHSHVGWMFTATKRHLSPKKFWGLCRSSVMTIIESEGLNEQSCLHIM